ncbi:aldo/keto reductase [Nocardioides humi]|uniref:Aldo/keto reductase n=1 Tax=Nocardioides humi TaxID=449461 RepID=A0ABN2ACH8_9ACTN|nr:aldo/keto reductase [Nocardioides humi]
MEARRLGADGPRVSALGLGCNNFGMKLDEPASARVVRAALDAGTTHFDTAERYGDGVSETVLGRALGADRSRVSVATKFSARVGGEGRPGDLASRVVDACDGSLRRLGTDRIDLYYQHFPDHTAPAEELLEALGRLVETGKIVRAGVSNADAPYLDRILPAERPSWFCALQVEWSLLVRDVERTVVPTACARGVGVVPYFPLASGLLTGKYRSRPYAAGSRLATLPWARRFATEENLARVDWLAMYAVEHGRSLLELALGWLLSHGAVSTVIAGATSAEQVRSNAAAATWRLSALELAEVDEMLTAGPAAVDG